MIAKIKRVRNDRLLFMHSSGVEENWLFNHLELIGGRSGQRPEFLGLDFDGHLGAKETGVTNRDGLTPIVENSEPDSRRPVRGASGSEAHDEIGAISANGVDLRCRSDRPGDPTNNSESVKWIDLLRLAFEADICPSITV